MSRKHRSPAPADPEYQAEMEARIERLRAMLALMAPEAGSAALGATRPWRESPRRRAQLLLPSPEPAKAANL